MIRRKVRKTAGTKMGGPDLIEEEREEVKSQVT